jgi:TonB family protein
MRPVLFILIAVGTVLSQENNAVKVDSLAHNLAKLDTLLALHKIDSAYYIKEKAELDSVLKVYTSQELSKFKNKTGVIAGNRSKKNIMSTVMVHLKSIRELYLSRLKVKKDLKGSMIVKIKVNSKGSIIFCNCIESNMGDPLFEKQVVGNIKKWKFDEIPDKKDITEFNYPFVFSL